jgi:hypothetical protein
MALIAMTIADTVDYVSDKDPSKTYNKVLIDADDESKGFKSVEVVGEGATVFQVGPLDVFLMGHIYDNASVMVGKQGSDEVGITTRMNQTNIESVRHGLKGFKNFTDAKGSAIKFETQRAVVNGRPYTVVSDATMNQLGIQLIQELSVKIKTISEVSPALEKNSETA